MEPVVAWVASDSSRKSVSRRGERERRADGVREWAVGVAAGGGSGTLSSRNSRVSLCERPACLRPSTGSLARARLR